MLFGLESAELTIPAQNALDILHLKGLRKILRMKTTFIDRANTNEEVMKRANEQLRGKDKIIALSRMYLERKQKFFCKVTMAEPLDPVRTVTFEPGAIACITHHPRRMGRPKRKWAQVEHHKIWNQRLDREAEIDRYNKELQTHKDRLATHLKQTAKKSSKK